jgi:hypothetical protein
LNKIEKARERELFRRLADGSLTADEFFAVEQRLLSDAGFRERYIRAIDVEAGLYEAFNFPGTFAAAPARTISPSALFSAAAASAAVLLLCSAWWCWTCSVQRPQTPNIASIRPAPKPVAMVTQVLPTEGTAIGDLKPGVPIIPGVLNVGNAQVQIEFLNGIQMNIEGPAELQIVAVDAATLISGKAAVRVPKGSRGFVLNTPDAAIVDLGTEFAVSVGKQGASEVQVVDGMIDVSLLGNDGNSLTSQRVTKAKSLRVNRNPACLEQIDSPSVALPKLQKQISAPLLTNDAYVQSVRASHPVIYWRFETLVDGRVPNEISPRWAGIIHAAPDDPAAIVVQEGAARFKPSEQARRIEPDEAIPLFNHESFTIEFWANIDNFHWATLLAVVPDNLNSSNNTLCLIESLVELPYKSSLVYSPGSFRFFYRHPASNTGGTNLFSDRGCTPGLWHHLVCIKTPEGLKLFLNSKLVRQFKESAATDDDPYRIVLGELDKDRRDRQLSGAIDEFALYLRAIDEGEVGEHYRAMTVVSRQNAAK